MRARGAVTVVAVVGLVCVSVAGAARGPKDPTLRRNAADVAAARAILLTGKDVGAGWKQDPPDPTAFTCKAATDESKFVETADEERSWTGADGVTSIYSSVAVYRSSGDALGDWNVYNTFTKQCAMEALRAGVGSGVAIKVLSLKRLPGPQLSRRMSWLRMVVRLTGSGGTVTLHFDVVAFGRGRTLVQYGWFGKAAQPPQTQQRLLLALAGRLAAAKRI